jgi:hypothetical protein
MTRARVVLTPAVAQRIGARHACRVMFAAA